MPRFTIELSGGLELLFAGAKRFDVELPGARAPMRGVISHVRTTLLVERAELFCAGDSVRPGILVLINEVDWELEGGADADVGDGDVVVFISTLHGG
jgi:ubiquitin related modifier 1